MHRCSDVTGERCENVPTGADVPDPACGRSVPAWNERLKGEGADMLSYIIVGSGYRSEYYARVARTYPHLFRAMYLCRTLTSASLEDIGKQFENRNHATVLAAIRKVEDAVKTSKDMAATVRDITSNISSKN